VLNIPACVSGSCSRKILSLWLLLISLLLLALLPGYWLEPSVPDDGWGLRLWWGISLSASKYGLAWMGLLFALLIAPDWKQGLLLLLPVLLVAGAGAWLNEHQLKPAMGKPRPSIEFLASDKSGPVLPEGTVAFYALPDKESRRVYLASKLEQQSVLKLPPLLKAHWIAETGFSFPSGHAFAAATLGGWFSLWGLCMVRRRWLPGVIFVWVLAVCYSRIMLGVHHPGDILVGAGEGFSLILIVVLLMLWWRKRNTKGLPIGLFPATKK
jgi:phosphatidylglycerophosphatase B